MAAMTKHVGKYSRTRHVQHRGQHRFEHWYVSNQVYFITGRCRDKHPAFTSEQAKRVFWDRFEHHASQGQFFPWVASVMTTHYHVLGYCRDGGVFGRMMQRIHGSVAKLVNDTLPQRRVPFWDTEGHQDYFDGCLRDERQCRLTYRYVLTQSVRHGICADWREYPHTRVYIELEIGVRRALELKAFLEGVPYKRYHKGRR
jgi:REP element-mobilizing transposase RayT